MDDDRGTGNGVMNGATLTDKRPTCRTCPVWYRDGDDGGGFSTNVGECRATLPVFMPGQAVSSTGIWPAVVDSEWCGHHPDMAAWWAAQPRPMVAAPIPAEATPEYEPTADPAKVANLVNCARLVVVEHDATGGNMQRARPGSLIDKLSEAANAIDGRSTLGHRDQPEAHSTSTRTLASGRLTIDREAVDEAFDLAGHSIRKAHEEGQIRSMAVAQSLSLATLEVLRTRVIAGAESDTGPADVDVTIVDTAALAELRNAAGDFLAYRNHRGHETTSDARKANRLWAALNTPLVS